MLAKVIIENGVKKIQALTADTGVGAPVGSIIAMYSNTVPSGYLRCDGSAFDETKYPALYQVLGDNHTPDLREVTLKGIGENPNGASHVKTGGLAVGEFIDDRIQNHQHNLGDNYLGGYPAAGTVLYVDHNGVNNDTKGVVGARTGGTTEVKAVGVNYCIKATSGLTENQQENVLNTINENNSYSTEEHPTGKKWIDGKPIYRKVLPNITFSTNVTQKVDVGASIDRGWVDLSKTVFHSTWFPSTRQLLSNSGMTDIFVNNNNSGADSNKVLFTTPFSDGSGVGGTTYIDIVVEYTKTTDN